MARKVCIDTGNKAVVMSVEVGARGCIGSSVYDLLLNSLYVATKEQKLLIYWLK